MKETITLTMDVDTAKSIANQNIVFSKILTEELTKINSKKSEKELIQELEEIVSKKFSIGQEKVAFDYVVSWAIENRNKFYFDRWLELFTDYNIKKFVSLALTFSNEN